MTYDDDNDRTDRLLFGVPYKATTVEARRVYAEVVLQPAWHDFHWRDDLLKSPGAAAVHTGLIGGLPAMSRESAEAYRQCIRNAIKAIEAMERER